MLVDHYANSRAGCQVKSPAGPQRDEDPLIPPLLISLTHIQAVLSVLVSMFLFGFAHKL